MNNAIYLTSLGFAIVASSALTWIFARRKGVGPSDDVLREASEARESRSRQEVVHSISLLVTPLAEQIRAMDREAAEGRKTVLLAQAESLAARFDAVSATLRDNRDDLSRNLNAFRETLDRSIAQAREDHDRSMDGLSSRVGERLAQMQKANDEGLERMRMTVDEKLQTTLERRLGESFSMVSERLEQVQRGFGEMQALAKDVGGLKRVLSNVKTRGMLGEAQLNALLDQFLAPGQYASQVQITAGSREAVDFAVRLPGPGAEEVWLPIDAKFPTEDYGRLMDAQDGGDPAAVEKAAKALENRIVLEAKRIREKYILPPDTTDFALLFLPSEGLYAEVIRRDGLMTRLQVDHGVTVVGPTTLSAFLNALQVGFKTLAITRRSSDIARTLHEVRSEFAKFGDAIDAVERRLEAAHQEINNVAVRTRAVNRRLRGVDGISMDEAAPVLDCVASPVGVLVSGGLDAGDASPGGDV